MRFHDADRQLSASASLSASKLSLATGAARGVLVVGIAASLFVGEISIDSRTVLQALLHHDTNLSQHVIVRDWRLPRALADVLVGAALAVAGAIMQAVTRNPLASPGIMGLNTGPASPRCWRWSLGRRPAGRS